MRSGLMPHFLVVIVYYLITLGFGGGVAVFLRNRRLDAVMLALMMMAYGAATGIVGALWLG